MPRPSRAVIASVLSTGHDVAAALARFDRMRRSPRAPPRAGSPRPPSITTISPSGPSASSAAAASTSTTPENPASMSLQARGERIPHIARQLARRRIEDQQRRPLRQRLRQRQPHPLLRLQLADLGVERSRKAPPAPPSAASMSLPTRLAGRRRKRRARPARCVPLPAAREQCPRPPSRIVPAAGLSAPVSKRATASRSARDRPTIAVGRPGAISRVTPASTGCPPIDSRELSQLQHGPHRSGSSPVMHTPAHRATLVTGALSPVGPTRQTSVTVRKRKESSRCDSLLRV